MRYVAMAAAIALLPAFQTQVPAVKKAGGTIRIYNAARSDGGVKLDLVIDDAAVGSAVEPDSISGPFTAKDPKSVKVSIKKAGQPDALVSAQLESSATDHILVVTGDPDKKLVLNDLSVKAEAPPKGQALINVLNLLVGDSDTDTFDVYLLKADETVASAVPVGKDVTSGSIVMSVVDPGMYTVVETKSGSKDPLVTSAAMDSQAKDRQVALVLPGAQPATPKVVTLKL